MVMTIERLAGRALVLAVLAAVGSCRPEGPADRPAEAGFVAVVGAGQTDLLWPVLQAVTARFQTVTPGILMRAEAPDQLSPNLQVQLIRRLRTEGARGLCVQVQDPSALAAELESARAGGVVVVTLMQPVPSHPAFLHSGVDPVAVGAALADALAEQIPGRGTVGVLYADDRLNWRLRRQGFLQRMVQHPHLTVLREFDCDGDPARAVRLMREATERFPGVDGWAAMDSWPVQAIDDGHSLLPPDCALVVPGPLPGIRLLLAADRCRAVVVADYRAIVTRALEMCCTVLQKEMVQVRTFQAPPRWVTQGNLDEFQRDWARWTATPEELVGTDAP